MTLEPSFRHIWYAKASYKNRSFFSIVKVSENSASFHLTDSARVRAWFGPKVDRHSLSLSLSLVPFFLPLDKRLSIW